MLQTALCLSMATFVSKQGYIQEQETLDLSQAGMGDDQAAETKIVLHLQVVSSISKVNFLQSSARHCR